jgi:hypothetical protein
MRPCTLDVALLLLLFLTPRPSCSISTPVPSHKVIQAHAASMENVLKSISIEGRGELHRTSSLPQVLTFRTSLRRFLTGSDVPHTHPTRRKSSRGDGRQREGEGELVDEEELARSRDPGGMSVLLMSQELSLESNQEAFLRRFTASQVPKNCVSSSLSLALPVSLPLAHYFIVTQCLSRLRLPLDVRRVRASAHEGQVQHLLYFKSRSSWWSQ